MEHAKLLDSLDPADRPVASTCLTIAGIIARRAATLPDADRMRLMASVVRILSHGLDDGAEYLTNAASDLDGDAKTLEQIEPFAAVWSRELRRMAREDDLPVLLDRQVA